MILYILLALILVGAVAYVVVNHIPKKFHWIVSLILLALIAYMAWLNYQSIQKPIRFNAEKETRYAKVIDNLKMIRDAQISYKKINKKYTADKSALVNFVNTAKIPIIKVTTVRKPVRRGLITTFIDERKEEITGYTDVRADFVGRDYKNMFKVPFTNTEFELKIDSIEKIEGIMSPLFEARIDKEAVIKGMKEFDEYLLREEQESPGGTEVKGKYITIGSLTDINVSGNWPPKYDGKKDKNIE